MSKTPTPNWDIMLQSVNSAIDNTYMEWKEERKKMIDSTFYSNGVYGVMSGGFEMHQKKCDELMSDLNKLFAKRLMIINHEVMQND